jgi:ribosomal protein L40E
MSKKCSNCGTPAHDGGAVFCNRCGARLPTEGPALLTCRKCGKTVTDRQSQFCDRCGSSLTPAVQAVRPVQPMPQVQPVQAVPPAVPAAKGTTCPTCGFENSGENRFYCKKCGAYIPKKTTVQNHGPEERAQTRKLQEGHIRIRPDGMDALRQKPQYKPVEAAELPRPRRKKAPQKKGLGSYRRVALGAAGAIVIILLIAFFAVIAPSILNAGSANATVPETKAPGLLDTILGKSPPAAAVFSNQATPVVTDTTLIP